MTEHQNGKRSWGATKQNWIKDALTKSELVDVTRSKTKAAQKKQQQQTNAKGKSRESSWDVSGGSLL